MRRSDFDFDVVSGPSMPPPAPKPQPRPQPAPQPGRISAPAG